MMENQLLSAEYTKELGKNIKMAYSNFHIKQELENEAQSSAHPLQGSELGSTFKVKNSSEINDVLEENIVKCELAEFQSDAAPDTFSQKQLQTVKFEKIPKTEPNTFGDEPPSSSDALYNNDTHSDTSSNSDPEHDPFADIDCHSSFVQAPKSKNPNFSASHIQLINEVDDDDSSNLSPSVKNATPAVTSLKHKLKRCKKNLQCRLCMETQISKSKLTTHLEVCAASHKNRSRFCVNCNILFRYTQGYKRHALYIHGFELNKISRYPLKCKLCPKSFLRQASLAVHLKSCHNINSPIVNLSSNPSVSPTLNLQCKLCLETQSSEGTLKTHLEICAASHKDRYRFCVLCNKLFYHAPGYKKHAFGKHGLKQEDIPSRHPFKCQLCPCSFALKKSLIAHSASKHESSTTSDHKLKLRPFNCLECPLRFKRPYGLSSHIAKSHSGELPVKCQVPNCEKSFKSNHSRNAHLRECHPNKPFQCQQRLCSKTFKTHGELRGHQLRHVS